MEKISQINVSNMNSPRGDRPVPNQFIIKTQSGNYFQSYASVIVFKPTHNGTERNVPKIVLDEKYWNWSTTTSKYRNQFLGEDTATTKAKIKSGEYLLANLN